MKEWYIFLLGGQQGPFTLLELKRNPDVTPDTLVWRPGFKKWIAMRYVPELKEVFQDDPQPKPLDELPLPPSLSPAPKQDNDTLALSRDPYYFLLWLLLLILLLFYLYLRGEFR